MVSSGNFSFNPTIDDLITEAYERCGIEGSDISAQMWSSALFSFNSVMVEAVNKQLNLWEVEPLLIALEVGVKDYILPAGTVDVVEGYRRTFTRQLAGTPATSAGGSAALAFDGLSTTACTQTSINGNISYDYGVGITQVISQVGYQANVTGSLTLVYEGSNNNTAWDTLASPPAQTYTAGKIAWLIIQRPAAYRYYRVRATGGSTLTPQEVYFCNSERDYVLGRLSRQDYDANVAKTQSGIPVSFYIERGLTPLLHLFLTPDGQYTVLKVNRIRQIYSITAATETLDSPFRFIEAITAMLAVKLAVKKAPDRLQMLSGIAQTSIDLALEEDRERVKGNLQPDLSGYRI